MSPRTVEGNQITAIPVKITLVRTIQHAKHLVEFRIKGTESRGCISTEAECASQTSHQLDLISIPVCR
jgi:hypothetical protein